MPLGVAFQRPSVTMAAVIVDVALVRDPTFASSTSQTLDDCVSAGADGEAPGVPVSTSSSIWLLTKSLRRTIESMRLWPPGIPPTAAMGRIDVPDVHSPYAPRTQAAPVSTLTCMPVESPNGFSSLLTPWRTAEGDRRPMNERQNASVMLAPAPLSYGPYEVA